MEKYPQYTNTKAIDQFLPLNFQKGIPQHFLDFCQRAVRQASGVASTPDSNSFNKGMHVACLLQGETLHVGFAELRTVSEDAACCGIALAISDIRQKKDSKDYITILSLFCRAPGHDHHQNDKSNQCCSWKAEAHISPILLIPTSIIPDRNPCHTRLPC